MSLLQSLTPAPPGIQQEQGNLAGPPCMGDCHYYFLSENGVMQCLDRGDAWLAGFKWVISSCIGMGFLDHMLLQGLIQSR